MNVCSAADAAALLGGQQALDQAVYKQCRMDKMMWLLHMHCSADARLEGHQKLQRSAMRTGPVPRRVCKVFNRRGLQPLPKWHRHRTVCEHKLG